MKRAFENEAGLKRRAEIPDDVWRDLTHPLNAGYTSDEVLNWTGEELFERYCEWHGLLGSWHRTLWRVTAALQKLKD
jgi:hypothetical protein